jgi:hypothetical protein
MGSPARWLPAAVAAVAVTAAMVVVLPAGAADAATVSGASGTQYEEVTISQGFVPFDTEYSAVVSRNTDVQIDVHNPNPADVGVVHACIISGPTPTEDCSPTVSAPQSQDVDPDATFTVLSSSGGAYVQVDYSTDWGQPVDAVTVYPLSWTPPQVLVRPPDGWPAPTLSDNVVTIPSVPGVEYWLESPDLEPLPPGPYSMTGYTQIEPGPADGYVFAQEPDGGGWISRQYDYDVLAPVAPTRSGNVLTIPAGAVGAATYWVNGSRVTGTYAMTGDTTVTERAGDASFFLPGATTTWSYAYLPSGGSPAPAAAPATIRSVKVKITRPPRSRKAGRATLVVVSSTGAKVAGTVVVTLHRGGVTKRIRVTVADGRATFKLPKLAQGVWKMRARFKPNAHVGSGASKTAKVRVKR